MHMQKKLKKCQRKRSLWTTSNESLFVELWGYKIKDLRGRRKNSHIYKEMAAQLAKDGLMISPEEVKAKITNLTIKFRKCKSCIGASGGSPSSWPLYDQINRIIGSHPIKNTQAIVEDTILDTQESPREDVEISETVSEASMNETYISQQCQSPPNSSQDMSSIDVPSKLLEMFEKFGNSFEKAMTEDKKCTEELMAIEKEKLKVFKDVSTSIDRLTNEILDFLKTSVSKDP